MGLNGPTGVNGPTGPVGPTEIGTHRDNPKTRTPTNI